MLETGELAWGQSPGLQAGLVLARPGTHRVDVVLEPALLELDVGDRGLRVDDRALEPGQPTAVFGDRGELGQGPAPVRQLGEGRVGGLQVEQPQLDGGVSVHGLPSPSVCRR